LIGLAALSVDHVLGAHDVGLDAFEGVVFGDGDVLQGGGVDHVIHVAHGHLQPCGVAHVADEEAQVGPALHRELLRHLVLLQLVSGEDDQLLGRIAPGHFFDEGLAERARAAGDQHRLAVQVRARLEEVAGDEGLRIGRGGEAGGGCGRHGRIPETQSSLAAYG